MANQKKSSSEHPKKKALSKGAEARWEKNHSESESKGKIGTESRWEGEGKKEPKQKVRHKGAESRWESEQNEN